MIADFFGGFLEEETNSRHKDFMWAWILVLRIAVLRIEQILLRIITHVIELCGWIWFSPISCKIPIKVQAETVQAVIPK